jgi:hypothetical protein
VLWSLDGVGTIVVNFASNPEGAAETSSRNASGSPRRYPRGCRLRGAAAPILSRARSPMSETSRSNRVSTCWPTPSACWNETIPNRLPEQPASPEQIQDRLGRHVRFRRIPVARAGRLDAPDAHLVKPGRIFDKTFPVGRILAILTVSPKGPRARPPAPEARIPEDWRRDRKHGRPALPPRRGARGLGAEAGLARASRDRSETKWAASP